jgi:Domain of unknown function (DUF4328)
MYEPVLASRREVQGYVPLGRRASWAMWALVAAVVLDAIAVGSDLAEWRLLERVEAGEGISDATLDANDSRQARIGLAQTGLLAVGALFFIVWFHRAYENVIGLGAKDVRYGAGWAIGAWFVPVLNLFRPKQIANDIWRASDPDAPADLGLDWKGGRVPAFLTGWWAAFLLSEVLYRTAGWLSADAETITELQKATWTYVGADALSVSAGVLALLVVRRTTIRQEARARLFEASL